MQNFHELASLRVMVEEEELSLIVNVVLMHAIQQATCILSMFFGNDA